ncbi:MAG: PqqD family protein [Clostridia bacterium]|nr:PqqD family protein [Clostridia bacterium]
MKIKDGFILREVAKNYVVVAVGSAAKDFNCIISLNETGAFLWKQLEKDVTEEQLLNAMLNEYEVEEDIAKKDIKAFIEKVSKANLLK